MDNRLLFNLTETLGIFTQFAELNSAKVTLHIEVTVPAEKLSWLPDASTSIGVTNFSADAHGGHPIKR